MRIGIGIGVRRGNGKPPEPFEEGSRLLMEDGTSLLLLEDGTSAILLEGNK